MRRTREILSLTLVILLSLLATALGATTLPMKKHKTNVEAYLSHLSRRGIRPNIAARDAAARRHWQGLPNERRRRGLRGNDLVVRQYVPRQEPMSSDGATSTTASDLSRSSLSDMSRSSMAFETASVSLTSSLPPETTTWSRMSVMALDEASSLFPTGSLSMISPGTSNTASNPSIASVSSLQPSFSASAFSESGSPSSGSNTLGTGSSSNPPASSWGSSPPSLSISASSAGPSSGPRPSSTVYDLENLYGMAYTIDALIGDDKTPVPVLVDTGSATFWVGAQQCAYCPSETTCTMCDASTIGMTLSHIDLGASCPKGRETDRITYGKGSVAGCVKNTSITIGELSLSNFPVLGITQIDEEQVSIADIYSGIWGVASSNLNKLGKTPVDVWYESHAISSPDVGFYLVRDEDPGESQVVVGDALNLGDLTFPIDPSHKAKMPRYGDDTGHYRIKLDRLSIWGNEVQGFRDRQVIADTGTTLLYVPHDRLVDIYGTLGNGTYTTHPTTGDFVIPCDLYPPTYPILTFTFGGVDFPIQYRDLVFTPVTEFPGMCYGAVGSLDTDDLFLIGGVFLVNVYHSVNTQTGELTLFRLKGDQA